MRWQGGSAVVVAVAALLVGCGSRTTVSDPPSSSNVQAGSGSAEASSALSLLLARYEKSLTGTASGFVGITSELVSQVGDWERAVGTNNKHAVLTGHVLELPTTATSIRGSIVRWADGRKMPVRTISAHQAVSTLQHAAGKQSCDGCTPVYLDDPRPTRSAVQTTSGNATVPAWSFAVHGSRVRITVVAVAAAAAVPTLPQASALPVPFVAAESAQATGPQTLVLHLVGAGGTGRVACGADYTATAVESRHAVAVLIRAFPHQERVAMVCTAIGYSRAVTVHLIAPLAGRAVLDVVRGQALPLQ